MRSSEPVYVLDATPVIHFAKINKLSPILDICKAYVTREVYQETVERGERRPDALVIGDAVRNGELQVYEVRNRGLVKQLQRHSEIHMGEAETLAAAKELKSYAVIDEAEGRAIAKTYGIKTRAGTLFLLFRLLAQGKVGVPDAEKMLDGPVKSGLYIDAHTLISARRKIRGRLATHDDTR